MRFKEGDYVSVIKKDRYVITDKGSIGIITEAFHDDYYKVRFIYITGAKGRGIREEYDIMDDDLDYTHQLPFDLR